MCSIVGCAHHQRREEPAQSTSSSDHTRDRTHVLRVSRAANPAEDRAGAQAQQSCHRQEDGAINMLGVRLECGNQCQSRYAAQRNEGNDLRAELVSQDTTEGTSDHGSRREACGTSTSSFSVEVVNIVQVGRQVVRERHEAAEHHRIKEAQLPGGLHLERPNDLRHQRGNLAVSSRW